MWHALFPSRGAELLSALGGNGTLTDLKLRSSRLGGPEAAVALAASLRRNSTLRSLDIAMADFGGAEGLRLVLSALNDSEEAPSRCAVASLNINWCPLDAPACLALAGSLARGAALEELDMTVSHVGPAEAVAIAEGIVAAGDASRLRSLCLMSNPIGYEGAKPSADPLSRSSLNVVCVMGTIRSSSAQSSHASHTLSPVTSVLF